MFVTEHGLFCALEKAFFQSVRGEEIKCPESAQACSAENGSPLLRHEKESLGCIPYWYKHMASK